MARAIGRLSANALGKEVRICPGLLSAALKELRRHPARSHSISSKSVRIHKPNMLRKIGSFRARNVEAPRPADPFQRNEQRRLQRAAKIRLPNQQRNYRNQSQRRVPPRLQFRQRQPHFVDTVASQTETSRCTQCHSGVWPEDRCFCVFLQGSAIEQEAYHGTKHQ